MRVDSLPRQLASKVVLTTGATSAIDRAIAAATGCAGARVVAADRDVEGVERACEAPASDVPAVRAVAIDVTDEPAVERTVADTFVAKGRIDVLVNRAAIGLETPFLEHALADLRRIYELNRLGLSVVPQ